MTIAGRSGLLGPTLVLAIAVGMAGCAVSNPIDRASIPELGIDNWTALDVTLVVNGSRVETVASGRNGAIDAASLPALPWTAELRSPSGRLLTSLQVEATDTATMVGSDGTSGSRGVFARVDLSCGRLTIWTGDAVLSGPAPIEPVGKPGDCFP